MKIPNVERNEKLLDFIAQGLPIMGGDESNYRDLYHRLRTRVAAEIETKPIEWLWPGRFALGAYSRIDGDPGLGKSQIAIDMAARVTRGGVWPVDGTEVQVGTVLLISAEDDPERVIVPRLKAAGADLDRVHLTDDVFNWDLEGPESTRNLSLETDANILYDVIHNLHDVRMVIIDPLNAFLGGADAHRDSEIRGKILAPLAQVAQDTNTAIISIGHLNKSSSKSPVYRSLGSVGFVAAARAVYAVSKDHDDPERRIMCCVKNNLGRDGSGFAYRIALQDDVPFVDWEPDPVDLTATEALDPEAAEKVSAIEEAKDFLRDRLAGGSVDSKTVYTEAEATGISRRTLERAKARLHIKSCRRHFAGDSVWELPRPVFAKFAKENVGDDGEHGGAVNPLAELIDDDVPF